MERKQFLLAGLGLITMGKLDVLKKMNDLFKEEDLKMPVLFIGHGNPMNAIEDNEFTNRWKLMGSQIPVPKAVICISAHWLTKGTAITAMNDPKTIHDFSGFPKPLFDAEYPAPGNPALAQETKELIKGTSITLDHDWGLDHGTWSVVRQMYPNANIPILQLSIDYNKPAQYHYELGKELAALRKKGVLIIGSGNMVHNIRLAGMPKGVNFELKNFNIEYGYDWTIEMNEIFKKNIIEGNHKALIDYRNLSKSAMLAIPTPDHYFPLLYTLALQDKNEEATFFNDKAVAGSLTMTSVKIS